MKINLACWKHANDLVASLKQWTFDSSQNKSKTRPAYFTSIVHIIFSFDTFHINNGGMRNKWSSSFYAQLNRAWTQMNNGLLRLYLTNLGTVETYINCSMHPAVICCTFYSIEPECEWTSDNSMFYSLNEKWIYAWVKFLVINIITHYTFYSI